jgi:hypothetical protein
MKGIVVAGTVWSSKKYLNMDLLMKKDLTLVLILVL